MQKYECVRNLFSQLLSFAYRPIAIELSPSWRLQAHPGPAKVDPAKPYLGSVPIEVEFYCGEERKLTRSLTMRCEQALSYPSLEDGEGGYAFRIESPKSTLLFRAMQAAEYVLEGAKTTVSIATDLHSKKGDGEFRPKLLAAIYHYSELLESFGGRMQDANQYAFIDYDSATNASVQDGQQILSSAVLLATLKGILKGELQVPLETINMYEPSASLPTVWKVAPGSQAAFWSEALADGSIFIGWPKLGDLRQYETRAELRSAYDAAYEPAQEPTNNMDSIWRFYQEMKPGDIVIANKGWRELTGIGRVTGDYEYRPADGDDFPHLRAVKWIVTSPVSFDENVFTTPTVTPVHSKRLTTIRHAVVSQLDDGERLWHELFGSTDDDGFVSSTTDDLIDDFHTYLQSRQLMYSREFVGRFITSLQTKPFLILSGGSGTGKTKIAQHFADYMQGGTESGTTPVVPAEERGRSFLLQVHPYMLNYQRMIVTVEMLESMSLGDLEAGVEIEVRFGGQTEKSLMKRQQKSVRLGFRKNFAAWLSEECQVHDSLRLTIENGGSVFAFTKDEGQLHQFDDNLAFVSVRPDWLNNRNLMGYYNPITELYEPTTMLKLMLRAEQNPGKPYFVILDEMNLAKVEYYFSDFLSCLESRRCDEGGELRQEAIELHQLSEPVEYVDAAKRVYWIPPQLRIPANVYFIGTVNIDETTYMFSPKVLDRANVLECNEIDLQSYWLASPAPSAVAADDGPEIAERARLFTGEGDYHLALYRKVFRQASNQPMLQEAFEVISELQLLLQEEDRPFGYRVFDEIMTYVMLALRQDSGTLERAVDAQIVQKILPKLHGNRKELEPLLCRLLDQFAAVEVKGDTLSPSNRQLLAADESYRFPLSGKKVYAMYKQLVQTGYCSFIC